MGLSAYGSFAKVYDLFMEDVPYEEWCGYIRELLFEAGIGEGLVLELGCGTGRLTRLLAEAGYDMIGVDNSEEMLAVAREAEDERDVRGLVLELGCGTGRLTRLLAEAGYDMIGVDNSEEMLAVAREAEDERDVRGDILYLLQDMRSFELYGTVRAVVSVCDSMNYLLKEEEMLAVFRLVNNYLDPGGLFIFDLNTAYKYQELLGETTISENREEGSFIWENYYDEESGINEYGLTLFIREEGELFRRYEETHYQRAYPLDTVRRLLTNYYDEESGINEYGLTLFIREEGELFRRYEETHYQRAYPLDTVRRLLTEAGMEFVASYDAFTREPPAPESERIYVIAREHGKRANDE